VWRSKATAAPAIIHMHGAVAPPMSLAAIRDEIARLSALALSMQQSAPEPTAPGTEPVKITAQ
jgi:hypothetical protein